MFDRKRKSLGKYPKVSLKDARGSARDILSDPGKLRRKEQGTEVAYAEAVERYLELKAAELSTNTWEGYARCLRRFEFNALVSEVRPYEIEDAIDRLKGQTNRSYAYTVLKVFFGWCLAREYCQANPMQHLKKPKIPTSRERVLDDDELSAIWKVCDSLGKYGAIVRLLMLTGQRRGQLDRLKTDWVEENGIAFPGSVMKNGLDHYCPIGIADKICAIGRRASWRLLLLADIGGRTTVQCLEQEQAQIGQLGTARSLDTARFAAYVGQQCTKI